MNLLLSKIIVAIFQVAIFSIIPFIVWIIFYRKKTTFFTFIGLKKVEKKTMISLIKMMVISTILYIAISYTISSFLGINQLATNEFVGLGFKGLPAAIVYAFFITALSEEILFRGFLLNVLMSKCSFKLANIIQALMFGLLHGVLFFSLVSPFTCIIIILLTSSIGWVMGYINMKAKFSIFPSWLIHALCNLFISVIALFTSN